MADEFQAELCGGTWWSSSRSIFGSSPCSSSSSGILDLGSFVGWPTASFLDIKTTSNATTDESNTASDVSIVIQDLASNNTNMAIGLSSSSTTTTTHEWDPTLISGRSDQSNYPPILQQDQNSSMNYRQERGVEDCPDEIQKDWRTTNTLKPNFSTIADHDHHHHHHHQDSSINDTFKSLGGNNQPSMITTNSSAQCAPCFPINSVSYGYSSSLLFDAEAHKSVPQQSLNPNRSFMNYPSTTSYQANLINEFSTCLPKLQQHPNHLQFPLTGQSFCNGSASALNVFRPGFFPSTQSQFLAPTINEKLNLLSLTTKANNDEVQGLGSGAKKTGSDPAFKRPRIETPSPLPTFKVRKEKLGDRITALQQLVSPFGKTDTASVLHEAIEYIKFLHDQVNVLSTPYMKNGSPIHRQQNSSEKAKGQEGSKEDLKSLGLCLVPLSSTFPVAAETTTDFWTPTFGGTFR